LRLRLSFSYFITSDHQRVTDSSSRFPNELFSVFIFHLGYESVDQGTWVGIYRLTIDNFKIEEIPEGVTSRDVMDVIVKGPYLFAGTQAGVFRSTTNGREWAHMTGGIGLTYVSVMGREVSTIVSEELPPGNYSRQWNASGCPSGVYFYRLTAGAYAETKKLNLVK
jgi:hypothetical protein